MRRFFTVLSLLLVQHLAAAAPPSCPPAGYTAATLQSLKTEKFAISDVPARNQLARGLLACLADPDPSLRDGIAYEAISHWLRAKELNQDSRDHLRDQLIDWLSAPVAQDDPGFRQPFAALVLSEVVRADRVEPHWDTATLARVVDVALAYLDGVTDLRGFDEKDGWRHGIAHGADVLLQLAVHPGTDAGTHHRMLKVLSGRLRPGTTHFYIYGEATRLATPVLLIAQRKTLQTEDWKLWLEQVSQPPSGSSWAQSYTSQSGLAQRHNVSGFLNLLAVGGMRIKDPAFTDLVLEQLANL